MRRPTYHRDPHGRLDVKMTPMIDVIFLLLIFFVCTASFQAPEEVLPVQMPSSGAIAAEVEIPEVADLGEIVVKVLWRRVGDERDARWEINGRRYEKLADVEDVLRAIREVKADLPVILDVEPQVPMEDVIDVHDVCLMVGLEQVQFAASVNASQP